MLGVSRCSKIFSLYVCSFPMAINDGFTHFLTYSFMFEIFLLSYALLYSVLVSTLPTYIIIISYIVSSESLADLFSFQ